MVVTITVNDKRGLATSTREARRNTGNQSNVTIVLGRAYNAFGEVTSETDGRGNVTTFAYNTMGKIILQTNPQVSWTSASGNTANTNPTQNNYYDISGRLIGVTDANGNDNTLRLQAGSGYNGEDALVLKEYHADGGVFESKYDVFGDKRITIDEVGKQETYTYDNMSRLTAQVHQQRPANSPGNPGTAEQLTDNYTYDELGHRVTHWNSQLTSSVKETMDYDVQGRLTAMVDLGTDATTYSYTWSNTIATTGLGTFGGWTKTTTNTAGLTEPRSSITSAARSTRSISAGTTSPTPTICRAA